MDLRRGGRGRRHSTDGAGLAKLEGDDLRGMIVIHLGDESDFVAKKAKAQKRPKKRE